MPALEDCLVDCLKARRIYGVVVGLRSEQSSGDGDALGSGGPSEHDQVGLGLLFDDFIDERGGEDHLRVAVGQKGVAVAGAIDEDVELGLALSRQAYRRTLFPRFPTEFGDEGGEHHVFFEGGEWTELWLNYRHMTDRHRGHSGIMVSALPSVFYDSFREMAAMRQAWQKVCPQERVIGFCRVSVQSGQASNLGSGMYLFCRDYYVWRGSYSMLCVYYTE